MKIRLFPLVLATLATCTSGAFAQFKMQNLAGEAPGQWLFGTIGVGKGADGKTPKTTALKGLAIRVGENGEAAVAYDLDLCRMVGAWTGKFVTPMNLMSRGEYPTAMGEVAFTTGEIAGFQTSTNEIVGDLPAWRDPRPEPFGSLSTVRFKGIHVSGAKTVLRWECEGVEILETPSYENRGGVSFFVRTFEVGPGEKHLVIPIALDNRPPGTFEYSLEAGGFQVFSHLRSEDGRRSSRHTSLNGEVITVGASAMGIFVAGSALQNPSKLRDRTGTLTRSISVFADKSPRRFQVFIWSGPAADGPKVVQVTRSEANLPVNAEVPFLDIHRGKEIDLRALTNGGPARWPETVTTDSQLAEGADHSAIAGYVVDTIKLPDPNPWNAATFIGGFDFFDDGRAALCTFHGDVLIADGFGLGKDGKPVNASGKVTWRRVASGLYHALGLKIVKGVIYVTCRDGIYRLKDLNGDGETDFYEVFNNDVKVTKNFHEFVFDLHTDRDGYFYFAKAGPVKNGGRGFDEIVSHHGTLLRVTPDGKQMEVMATGFRAPNGIGVGPNGEMTSGDNEGTWTPMCRLNWIKPGGFYGVVDLAHRAKPPTDYDRPLCWLPKKVDNSSGSQVWVPDNDKWGPWRGQLLHLSYGQCALYGVLKEETIDPEASSCCQSVMQGGVVQFPGLKFDSGIMRARFHPVDGQLYVAGLRGWQTSGLKNGCFQRVRYTGAPVRMPVGMKVKKGGIELQFSSSLDTQSAADPENWSLQVWNYIWSSAYGSPEISTTTPLIPGPNGEPTPESLQGSKKHRDPLTVASVKIGTDDRTVFLEIPDLKPVMQMAIKYQLKAADGAEVKGEIVNTIHSLGEE